MSKIIIESESGESISDALYRALKVSSKLDEPVVLKIGRKQIKLCVPPNRSRAFNSIAITVVPGTKLPDARSLASEAYEYLAGNLKTERKEEVTVTVTFEEFGFTVDMSPSITYEEYCSSYEYLLKNYFDQLE